MKITREFLESFPNLPYYNEEHCPEFCKVTYTVDSYEPVRDKNISIKIDRKDVRDPDSSFGPIKPNEKKIIRVPLSEIYKGNIPSDDLSGGVSNYLPLKELIKRVEHVTQFFPPDNVFTNLLVLISDELYTKEQYLYYLNYAFRYGSTFGGPTFFTPQEVCKNQILDSNIHRVISTFDTLTTCSEISSTEVQGTTSGLTEPSKLYKLLSTYSVHSGTFKDEPVFKVIPVLDMLDASRSRINSQYTGSLTNGDFLKFVRTYTVKAYKAIKEHPDVHNDVLDSFLNSSPYNLERVADALGLRDPNYRSNPYD